MALNGTTLKWFDKAVKVVLRHEDYKYDTNPRIDRDPADSGGTTKFGISQAHHPGVNVVTLTLGGAIQIYRQEYMQYPYHEAIKRFHIACRLYDLGVLCGYVTAAKFLQRACNKLGSKLSVDGKIGPLSIAAINGHDWGKLYDALLVEGESYFRKVVAVSPKNKKFLQGWLNRLKDRAEFKCWTIRDEELNK